MARFGKGVNFKIVTLLITLIMFPQNNTYAISCNILRHPLLFSEEQNQKITQRGILAKEPIVGSGEGEFRDIMGIPSQMNTESNVEVITSTLQKLQPWELDLLRTYGFYIKTTRFHRSVYRIMAVVASTLFGGNYITLSPSFKEDEVLHELGHIIGFFLSYIEGYAWLDGIVEGIRIRAELGTGTELILLDPLRFFINDGDGGEKRQISFKEYIIRLQTTDVVKPEEVDNIYLEEKQKTKLFEKRWCAINKRPYYHYGFFRGFLSMLALYFRKRNFVSLYASKNFYEDVAETYMLLRDNPARLRALSSKYPVIREKVELLEQHLSRLKDFYKTKKGKRIIWAMGGSFLDRDGRRYYHVLPTVEELGRDKLTSKEDLQYQDLNKSAISVKNVQTQL